MAGRMERLRSSVREIHPLVGSNPIVGQGLILIVLYAVFRSWALSGAWYVSDDFAFISRAAHDDLSWAYLFESYGGHLMPAGFALTWVLTHWHAFEWSWWWPPLLTLQVLAAIGMLRLLLSMFGRNRAVLALLLGYLTLVFTLPASVWFAAGVNQLPLQVALAFGLRSHLAYLRTRRRFHLISSMAWTVFGLAFYEKTLLLFVIYFILALGWFAEGNFADRMKSLWGRYREGIITHGVVAIGYLALYLKLGATINPSSEQTALAPVTWTLVGRAFSTAAVGGPISWKLDGGLLAAPSDLVILISWLAVGLIVAGAFRTRIRSVRAWTVIGSGLMANVLLIASARANLVGPNVGLEYRYQTESAALWVLSIGLAYLPLLGARETVEFKDDADLTYESPTIIQTVTIVIAVAAMVSSAQWLNNWDKSNKAVPYFENIKASAAAMPKKPVPMANLGLPVEIMWAFRYPENTYQRVFKPLRLPLSYPMYSVDSLYVATNEGVVVPAVIPQARSMQPGPEACGYVVGSSPTRIPLDAPVMGSGWWIKMDYVAQEASVVNVYGGNLHHKIELPAGLHAVFFQTSGEFQSFTISRPSGSTQLCVVNAVLGLPTPLEAP